MTTTVSTATPETTHEQVMIAILDALPASGLIPVPTLRRLIPGSWWAQTRALGELDDRGEIYIMKVHGTPLVGRPLFPPSPGSGQYPALVIP